GQPDSIVADIENMVRSYIEKVMLIENVVLQICERTFGVLTKIDLMDKGTDAVDVSLFLLSIQSLISKTVAELEGELSRLGKPIAADAGVSLTGKLYAIMEICRIFDQIYKEHLDGV
ncbi:hypothetical protein BHM03_00028696, partial [Ensete ventricosum]